MKKNTVTAFASASTGNVGVGFDVLGLCLKTIGDEVTITKTDQIGKIEIVGISDNSLTLDPERNTATAGLIKMLDDLNLQMGFKVKIKKGIPLGSGLGGSAASAVAGTVAANALLKKPLSKKELFKYALIGESVASGGTQPDNVAPCLFGGMVLIQQGDPFNIVPIPFPSNLVIVTVLPNLQIKTKDARDILKENVSLKDYIKQSSLLSGFIAGCFRKDINLISDSFKDILIEPQRAHLIPGFHDVKHAAIKAGALGCTISGAGPTVFAISQKTKATKIKNAMINAFNEVGAGPAKGWISPVNKNGASIL